MKYYLLSSVLQTAILVIKREQWPVEHTLVSSAQPALLKLDRRIFVNAKVLASTKPLLTKAVSRLHKSVSK